MIPCPLRDPIQMAALFAQFGATPTTMYQEQPLNDAASYALFLEDHERDIIADCETLEAIEQELGYST